MTAIIRSNAGITPTASLGSITAVTLAPADLFALYEDRVLADSGVIEDAAVTLAAFEDAVAGNYLTGAASAIGTRFGVKTSGANYVKFYSLTGVEGDAIVTGTIPRSTALTGYATALVDTTDKITANVVFNKNGLTGIVGVDAQNPPSAVATHGVRLDATIAGKLYRWQYGNQFIVDGVTILQGAPEFANTSGEVHFLLDNNAQLVLWGDQGIDKKSASTFTPIPADTAVSAAIQLNAGVGLNWCEQWVLNNCSYPQMRACAYDAHARF